MPSARREIWCHPRSRTALSMVTSHQQPAPRVGRPGRESNPGIPRSQSRSVVQTQGASITVSSGCITALVTWNQSEQVCRPKKGP
jgi:hypothetical protein